MDENNQCPRVYWQGKASQMDSDSYCIGKVATTLSHALRKAMERDLLS